MPNKAFATARIPHVNFEFLSSNGEVIETRSDACFSGFDHQLRRAWPKSQFMNYKLRDHVSSKEISLAFLDFSKKHFPYFRDCVGNQDNKEILEKGAKIDIGEQPYEKIFTFLTHIRYIDEMPELVEFWYKEVKTGSDPEQALFKAHMEAKISNPNLGGHGLFYEGLCSKEDQKKFNPSTNKKFLTFFDKFIPLAKGRKQEKENFSVQDTFATCFKFREGKNQW